MKRYTTLFLTLFLLFAWCPAAGFADGRPGNWARPLTVDGVPNLYQVSETLFRSAQPSEEGMKNLRKMGIVTIINLRSAHSDLDEIGEINLNYESVPMKAWRPRRRHALRFLEIVSDPGRGPYLVHCQHGSDRTGAVCALYRVVVQGWSKADAIEEMKKGGYGFHRIWSNLPRWIRKLNIELIRREIGLRSAKRRSR